jgi:hypothetical protein
MHVLFSSFFAWPSPYESNAQAPF